MPAAANMALDEALLLAGGPATLRLYGWDPPALSLGYFQRVAQVDRGLLERHGLALVRRPTGGGAIAHVHELTFAFTAPEGLDPYVGSIAASYERVHEALAAGLARLRVEARRRGSESALLSDASGSRFYCFYHSAGPDLHVARRKVLGSAQRRCRGRVLHHGSLPLGRNPVTPFSACVEEAAGRPVSFDEVAGALLWGLRERLGMVFVEGGLSEREVTLSHELTEKYASPEFTGMR
ncbi:MAG: biotin/lipoate A/B protein ligase family protein [Planctomycetota bacterium]